MFNSTSVLTRMTKSASTALRFGKFLNFNHFGLLATCKNDLRNAVAIVDDERLVGKVYEDLLQFAAIIGVDGARRIQYRNAVLESETAARTHLTFITFWNFDL